MMFKTYAAAATFNPFTNEDETYWTYVEIALNHQWMLVKISSIPDEESFTHHSTLLISIERQLEDLVTRGDVKIVEVHLVAPAYMSQNQKTWQMYKLAKVLKGTHRSKKMKSPIYKYELENGDELFEPTWGEKIPKSIKFETVYEATTD